MPIDRFITYARAIQSLLWLACSAVSWVLYPRFGFGVFLGGLLMAVNLLAIAHLVRRCRSGHRLGGTFAALLGGKFVLLLVGLVAIVQNLLPDLTGLALGLSTFFVGIVAAFAAISWSKSKTETGRQALRPLA